MFGKVFQGVPAVENLGVVAMVLVAFHKFFGLGKLRVVNDKQLGSVVAELRQRFDAVLQLIDDKCTLGVGQFLGKGCGNRKPYYQSY